MTEFKKFEQNMEFELEYRPSYSSHRENKEKPFIVSNFFKVLKERSTDYENTEEGVKNAQQFSFDMSINDYLPASEATKDGNIIDYFMQPVKTEKRTIHLLVHGGYWAAMQRRNYRSVGKYLAQCNNLGMFVLLGYQMTPKQTVAESNVMIADEIEKFLELLTAHWFRFSKLSPKMVTLAYFWHKFHIFKICPI